MKFTTMVTGIISVLLLVSPYSMEEDQKGPAAEGKNKKNALKTVSSFEGFLIASKQPFGYLKNIKKIRQRPTLPP